MGTKNLPDALRWHFAKYWQHIFSEYGIYEQSWGSQWKKTEALLERAVALPVMVNMTEDRISQIAETVTRIAEKTT
jgi:dTDP-4-amino-4,6-dideoxygalactose transaminase